MQRLTRACRDAGGVAVEIWQQAAQLKGIGSKVPKLANELSKKGRISGPMGTNSGCALS
jgi:hypothetical protein